MRHLKAGRRLGLNSAHRHAMLRNLVTSLMRHERLQTTEARAKELRKVADRVITLARRVTPDSLVGLEGAALQTAQSNRVHAIRQARLLIEDRELLERIFSVYSARYATRPGGYTRILKLGTRPGDQAKMVLIELVQEPYAPKTKNADAPAAEAAV